MKNLRFGPLALAFLAVTLVIVIGGCKSSGVAVSPRGQVMNIAIEVPTDLSEGETNEMVVRVANRGVNEIGDVFFQVEMPSELIVQSEIPSGGVERTDRMASSATRIFQYRAGDIEAATSAEVKYHVRAAFGSLDRTGDIKVTAWSEDLPGDRLVETKYIRLRR
jgi:hypothetical protein